MRRLIFPALLMFILAAPYVMSETTPSAEQTLTEEETLICLRSFPPRCFLKTGGLLGKEIAIDPQTNKPIKGADGKFVIKEKTP